MVGPKLLPDDVLDRRPVEFQQRVPYIPLAGPANQPAVGRVERLQPVCSEDDARALCQARDIAAAYALGVVADIVEEVQFKEPASHIT